MPGEGPELDAQREVRKQWDIEWASSVAVITGTSSLEPVTLDILERPEEGPTTTKQEEALLKETSLALESQYSTVMVFECVWIQVFVINCFVLHDKLHIY